MSPTGTTTARSDGAPCASGKGVATDGVESPRPNVLLVEDDTVTREVVLLLLGRLGYRADVAENGIEALAAVHAGSYDLVLMDVHMPEMDGIEATRRIRVELPAQRQPTVIAMTAGFSTDDQVLCRQAGMDDFLPKPVHVQELAAVLGARGAPNPAAVTLVRGARDAPVYDPTVLVALAADMGAEGEEVRRDLIETYLSQDEHTVRAITVAGHDGDGEALAFTAHALKAASATLGLLALSGAATDIDAACRTAAAPVDIALAAAGLVAECRRAAAALRGALQAEPGRQIPAEAPPAPGT